MKIRSLLLGSVAAAGLSTAGFAADLGVVTSLDVCDELGLSGLTISSDDNCLQISGNVSVEYNYGDYSVAGGNPTFITFDRTGASSTLNDNDGITDNKADIDAWLKFVGTASTDFGPASATIKLISEDNTGTKDWSVGVDEAWVGIGDTTVIQAGYKSSIFNTDNDAPLNYLGLFNSDDVDAGVGFAKDKGITGDGAQLQIIANLGNGLKLSGAAEQLGGPSAGIDLVGVVAYAGDGIAAHVSGAVSEGSKWNLHAGFTGTWDPVTVVGAIAANDGGWWNALGSMSAKFDMFTLAVSGEATSGNEYGIGGSISAKVTDGVTLNLGGKYFTDNDGAPTKDAYQVEAGIVAAVTETITVNAAVGAMDSSNTPDAVFYGKAGLAWAPGGGFTSSIAGEVNSLGDYKATFKAAKSIK